MPRGSSSSVRIIYPKFDREELIQKLKEKMEDLSRKLPLALVVLFGSYARRNYTVASDVDLLILYGDKKRKDAFARVKKTLDIPLLEPHVHSEDEYERLRRVIDRMIADGVVLFSREELEPTKPTKSTK
ncbi:MAG: nucleotidyltransferase domain-containing protein [Candidatus Hodarchaeota archaeon]